MTIDPKWGFVLNAIAVLATALLGLSWATVLPTKDAATLMTILTGVVTVVNTILHGISAPTNGPITKFFNPTQGS